ncbi:unnamed protein product [Closterium sp. NIES-53]
MAAQKLRWLTYLLTDLGEPPRSPPVLYVDNKAMLALCREQRLEHRTKHIALRYFLARELQQRGQLRLAYVASEANTADVFTKALAPCDHQRCCTQLGLLCFALLDCHFILVHFFSGGTGAGGAGDGGFGAGDPGAVGAGAGGTGAGGAGAGGVGAGGAVSGGTGAGGTVRLRPYFVPLLQQPASPLPAPSPYTEQTGGLTEHFEPDSCPASPVRAVRTGRRVPRPRPPPVPGTHAMALRPSSVPMRVPLPPPPESFLPTIPDLDSDLARAASPTFSRLLATVVTDPSFESTAASALVAELVDCTAACRLDCATALVAESESVSPPSVGGECALGTDVVEDRQEDFECLAAAVPRFASMLLAPQGDPDAPDIPTPRSYAEAIMGRYFSQWQAAMEAEMASWKSIGTYIDAVPPSRANIVDGMWIFRGRPSQFDTWLDDLQLYLLRDSRDSVSLFDLVFGTAPAPPTTASSATRSQWLTRDAAARLAIRNHLLLAECARFGQHRTAQALYDAVVSPAIAALGCLLLPYLFPELSAFATVEDLVSHLRASDDRYRAALPTEFPNRNLPPMDHFLSLDPTSITVDLLEQHLLAAGTSAVSTSLVLRMSGLLLLVRSAAAASARVAGVVEGAARVVVGAAVEAMAAVDVVAVVGVVEGVGALVAAVEAAVGVAVVAAVAVVAVGLELSVEVLEEASGSGSSVEARPLRPSQGLHWAELLRSGVAIFDLDYDAILSAMYALSASAKGDCYLCVPPDPGIEAPALGAGESSLPGTAPAEALHTFTLDSGASRCFFCDCTTLNPLPTPVPVRLADPSEGPVVARSSIVLPCPAVPSSSLSGLHLPLFSTNLVSTAALQDAMVTTTTLGGQRVSICTCTRTLRHLATSSSTPLLVSPPVPPDSSVGHPSLPRLHGMHSRLLVSGLPRSLPPLPPSPPPPCLPCVEGRQCAAPHSLFPQTTAPLQTLNMDVWGPARVSGQGRERYFLLVVDDYMRNTTVFPLRSKGQVVDVLIPRAVRLQLRERFREDLLVLRLHSDRGGKFSSDLLRDFCCGEGILQSFMLSTSPQQNGIAERPSGLVMETNRTSMIHAAAPHFLWLFAIRVPGLRLSCLCSRFFRGQALCLRYSDVPSDESVLFYRLFPYRTALPPPSQLFLAPGLPLVDPLPPQVPAPSGVSHVDPLPGTTLVEVAVGSGAARGAVFGGAEFGGAESGVAESEGAGSGGDEPGGEEPRRAEPAGMEPGGVEPEGVETGGAELEGAESGGAKPQGAALFGGPAGASPRLSLQQLREWRVRRARLWSGATGAGGAGAAGARGTCVTTRAGGTRGYAATGLGGARSRVTRAAGTGGVGGAGAGDPTEPGATGVGGSGTGTLQPRPYFVPLLQLVLGVPSSTSLTPPLLCPPPDQSQPLQPPSPLPAPSPYTEQSSGLIELREPPSHLVLPVRTACSVPYSRPPPNPGTHAMALRPSSVPLRVPLLAPPESSRPAVPDLASDRTRATSPFVPRLLATPVTDPSFESAAASALLAELLDFAAACRLDYATALVVESATASPPSIGGECALGTHVIEDRQEDFECLAAAVPRCASMLLAPEGDPDAPDILTPRSYAEVITDPNSSQWQEAMDAEMASWKSTGTYVDAVPPPGANIVDGMWIFRRDYELHSLDFTTAFLQGSLHEEIWLCRPPGFTWSFPASTQWSLWRLVYRLRQAPREWHDTLRTTLAALGFAPSTADPSLFLRIDTSLPPFYVLVYVLQRFGFQFSSPQPTPLSTGHSLSAPPSDESVEPSGPYPELVGCLMYLMTCTRPDLAYPLSLLARYVAPGRHQKVHWDAAKRVLRYLCSTSGMGLVLGGRGPVVLTGHADASWVDDSAMQWSSQGYTFSLGSGSVSWRSTRSSSVLSSSCEAEIYARAMAAQELRWLTYLLTELGEQPHSPPVMYVDNKAMIALCQEHRLEHRTKHIALRYFLARELQQHGQLRLAYVATRANTANIFTKALLPSDSQPCFAFLDWSCDC